MTWQSAVVALALAWSAAADARHSNAVLDPRRATLGVTLELVELPRSAADEPAKYRLRVAGLPANTAFGIWTRSIGRDFVEIVSGLRPDATGMLVVTDGAGAKQRLEDIEVEPGPYPRGAAWWVAVASEDYKTAAFARVIPYPIAARDGSCSISLEMISMFGNRFIVVGSGFPPGEDVDIESHASGAVSRKRERVYADGALPMDVVSHGSLGADALARYAVKARTCGPALEYRWGEAAVSP